MGQPVVHFEVIGRDGEKLRSYYSELFGWEIDANNPMNYGVIQREGNTNAEGVGIGGGVGGPGPERVFGPETIMEDVELGQFTDPDGHVIGLVKGAS